MNAKLPPSCNGRVSWLRYEGLVRDWITFTVIEPAPARQGPLLNNSLLDNEKLIGPTTFSTFFADIS